MANKITYVKGEEPAFLKAFKQNAGYKEGPTIDSKKEKLQYEEDDRSDNEDEKPTIVILKDSHLSAEEVEQHLKANPEAESEIKTDEQPEEEEDQEENTDGKIRFKKPVKRQGETKSDLQTSSNKKSKQDKIDKKKSTANKVKNKSLLSFGDDDEDEDSDT